MAEIIANTGKIKVIPKDPIYLKTIKEGKLFDYDELIRRSEELELKIKESYSNSNLRDVPNYEFLNDQLYKLRLKDA